MSFHVASTSNRGAVSPPRTSSWALQRFQEASPCVPPTTSRCIKRLRTAAELSAVSRSLVLSLPPTDSPLSLPPPPLPLSPTAKTLVPAARVEGAGLHPPLLLLPPPISTDQCRALGRPHAGPSNRSRVLVVAREQKTAAAAAWPSVASAAVFGEVGQKLAGTKRAASWLGPCASVPAFSDFETPPDCPKTRLGRGGDSHGGGGCHPPLRGG